MKYFLSILLVVLSFSYNSIAVCEELSVLALKDVPVRLAFIQSVGDSGYEIYKNTKGLFKDSYAFKVLSKGDIDTTISFNYYERSNLYEDKLWHRSINRKNRSSYEIWGD